MAEPDSPQGLRPRDPVVASEDGIDESFTEGILEEILEDIATPRRRLLTGSESLDHLIGDGRNIVHSDLIEGLDGERIRFVQVRTLPQPRRTGTCGYYSLYNALILNHYTRILAERTQEQPGEALLEAIEGAEDQHLEGSAGAGGSAARTTRVIDGDRRESRVIRDGDTAASTHGALSHHLRSRAGFWRLVRRIKQKLAEYALEIDPAEGPSVWSLSSVEGDVLERSHLQYLIAHHPAVLEDMPENLTVVQELGLDAVRAGQCPRSTKAGIDAAVRKLRGMETGHVCFMVGLAVHWVSVVVVKYRPADTPGGKPEYAIVLADSVNSDIVGRSTWEVRNIVANYDFSNAVLPMWMEMAVNQGTLEGTSFFVSLLARCLGSWTTVDQEWARLRIHRLLSEFPQRAFPMDLEDPAKFCLETFRPSSEPVKLANPEKLLDMCPDARSDVERAWRGGEYQEEHMPFLDANLGGQEGRRDGGEEEGEPVGLYEAVDEWARDVHPLPVLERFLPELLSPDNVRHLDAATFETARRWAAAVAAAAAERHAALLDSGDEAEQRAERLSNLFGYVAAVFDAVLDEL